MPAPPSTKERATEATASTVGWLDERTGLSPFLRGFLYRKVPKGTNWYYTLGSATMFAFLSQAVTGVFLAMYYEPDPTRAYESAAHITNDVFLGELVRGMHKWGSSVMIILIFLHMGRTFVFGAYKYPQELADLRRDPAGADPDDGPHRLPAAVRPAVLLGHGRGGEHQRLRPDRRALPGRLLRAGAGLGSTTIARFAIHMLLVQA